MAVLMATLPRGALVAGGSTADEAVAELRRACAVVEARLAVHPADVSEAWQLVRRGDSLLGELAGSPGSMSGLEPAIAALDEAAARAVTAIGMSKARASREALAIAMMAHQLREAATGSWAGRIRSSIVAIPAWIEVDPWSGPDQECGWFPDDLGPVTTDVGFDLPEIPFGRLPESIPPRFRLAEWLGIGRNRVHAALTWIEPRMARRQVDAEWTIVVRARLRCELVGRFVSDPQYLSPIGSGDGAGGDGAIAESPFVAAETFRLVVESRGWCDAGINRSGADLGNPNAFLIEDRGFVHALRASIPENPWHREELAAAAPERGWRLERLGAEEAAAGSSEGLDSIIGRRLADLRAVVLERMRRDPQILEASTSWGSRFRALEALFRDPVLVSSPSPPHPRIPLGIASLETLDPAAVLSSGWLDADALGRIVPATRRALASVRRAMLVMSASPDQRPDAALLAADLDRLEGWLER